ncbi:MAG: hypothetical protein M1324_02900 [Patescibacteria group bacterium]|nr:hypothetical protein [Patescibacteria group bacterium]
MNIEQSMRSEYLSDDEILQRLSRFNNLHKSIELGIHLALSDLKDLATRRNLSKEEIGRLRKSEEFSSKIVEERIKADLTKEQVRKYVEILNNSSRTAEDTEFLKQYLQKVEKVFEGMIASGYTEKEICQ